MYYDAKSHALMLTADVSNILLPRILIQLFKSPGSRFALLAYVSHSISDSFLHMEIEFY